jgi:pimeloyl-ACP methyl ester carboxylesterase
VASLATAAGLTYREAGAGHRVALLVHGYPNSSYMWEPVLAALAEAGWRAIAPDLAGFGDSPADPPGTWERHVERLERFRSELGIERAALVVHDWGGLIGLRWACDHPEAVQALVITNTGFFPDGRWHDLAAAMRTPGQGEQLIDAIDRDGFATMLGQLSRGFTEQAVEEYWKAFADPERRRGQLELYRSGDFEKLADYEGCLGTLGVPTLIVWGAADPFAPVGGAHRFHAEIPGSELVVLDEPGHFLVEDAPERVSAEIARFLAALP